MKKILFVSALCLLSFAANAQVSDVNPFLKSSLSDSALKNILGAERVFCYTVEMQKSGYQGYTLDQMALTGFCGILSPEEQTLLTQEFFKNEENISTTTAQCTISPRIMLRFYRGVDTADVLVSHPCPSISVFYGGSVKSFNAEPINAALDGLSKAYEQRKTDFVSPALLNQMLPIGVAVNDEQKALLQEKQDTGPVRNWNTQGAANNIDVQNQPAAVKGWNKINMKKN